MTKTVVRMQEANNERTFMAYVFDGETCIENHTPATMENVLRIARDASVAFGAADKAVTKDDATGKITIFTWS